MTRYDVRFSAKAGTKAENFEFIGYRPGIKDWAELLIVTDCLEMIKDRDDYNAGETDHFRGFVRIEIVRPGEARPCNIVQTPETKVEFLYCLEPNDWFASFCGQLSAGKLIDRKERPKWEDDSSNKPAYNFATEAEQQTENKTSTTEWIVASKHKGKWTWDQPSTSEQLAKNIAKRFREDDVPAFAIEMPPVLPEDQEEIDALAKEAMAQAVAEEQEVSEEGEPLSVYLLAFKRRVDGRWYWDDVPVNHDEAARTIARNQKNGVTSFALEVPLVLFDDDELLDKLADESVMHSVQEIDLTWEYL